MQSEYVLFGLQIFNTILLLVGLFIFGIVSFVILDRMKGLTNLPSRINEIENYLSNSMADGIPPGAGAVFRSLDGKYSASSLDELIAKMQADPESGITPGDVDDLRNFFNNLLGGDDSTDEPDEPWKKGDK